MNSDRIEKQVVLRAPRSRVWRALTDSQEYGTWFGAAFDGPFVAGQTTSGRIAKTKVDAEVARLQEPHVGKPLSLVVEAMDPETLFAFRWQPAVPEASSAASEASTLVTFRLEDVEGGTRLTITESGFAKLPEERRKAAFDSNDAGWGHQCRMIARYVDDGA
ncbi:MAG: hypothetical protein JWP97_5427 [Labilithrix sp.]|nr:hypothetical protein [Labilithrix sp.]